MNWYELSRQFFDFSFEHHECGVYHTAIYMLAIEQNNRYWWKKEFWFPTAYNCDVLGIGNRNTYLSALKDLVDWWFIEIICESKNQFKATVISLCHIKIDIATDTAWYTALDKALIWQDIWHWYAIDTIDKQVNNETKKQVNNETIEIIPKNTQDKEIQNTKISDKWWEFCKLEWFASYTARVLIDKWWKPDMNTDEFTDWIAKFMEARDITYSESDYKKWKWAFQSMFTYWDEQDKWSRKKKMWLSRMTNQKWFKFNLPFTKK